jgi:hypothetical protein
LRAAGRGTRGGGARGEGGNVASPLAQAHDLVARLLDLLRECRTLLPLLEAPRHHPEPSSAEAERILYFALLGALEAGLVRTMEEAVTVLRHASQPLGPIGAEWLQRQERRLEGALKGVRQANAGWLSHAIVACTFAELGQAKEARAAIAQALKIKPDLKISFISANYPFRDKGYLDAER